MRILFLFIVILSICSSFRQKEVYLHTASSNTNFNIQIESNLWCNLNFFDSYYPNLRFEKIDTIFDSIICIKLPIIEDVAIGYHDFYSTESVNFGNAIQLAAYTIPGALGGLNKNRALFKFNIPPYLDSVQILSATLNLIATGELGILQGHTGINNQGIIEKVLQPWNAYSATWNNQPGSSSINQVVLENSTSPDQDYKNIIITNLFLDLKKENYGLKLKQKTESPTNALLFCSSDHPDSSRHPFVEVCYLSRSKNTGINENSFCNIQYYPNPVSHKLFIKFSTYDNSTKKTCNIYGINGQFIRNSELTYPITTIELSSFPSGLYLLEILDSSCKRTFKFEVIKN